MCGAPGLGDGTCSPTPTPPHPAKPRQEQLQRSGRRTKHSDLILSPFYHVLRALPVGAIRRAQRILAWCVRSSLSGMVQGREGRKWICVGGRGDGDRIPPTLHQIHYYLLVASHQVSTLPFTSSYKD